MIIFDSNYVAYVSKFSLSQGLSYRGTNTEIIFGFLKQVLTLAEQFKDSDIVFCWDSKESLRKKIYPEYKANRKENLTEEQKEENQIAYAQFNILRKTILPELGFSNNFMEEGYESDDLIASLVLARTDKPIVISSDKDLYQLLDHCNIYNITKREIYNKELFTREYGIRPFRWITVKSIAGCNTDNVKGVEKVGEKTAIKYLKGEMKPSAKTYDSIINFDISINKKLIELPFTGCPNINERIFPNDLKRKKFISIFDKFGLQSFINNIDKWEKIFCSKE